MIGRCCRVAVLTDVTSTFVPLVGGLVDESQVGMKQGVTRKEEEEKDQKAQHEDNTGESQEQMLQRDTEPEKNCNIHAYVHILDLKLK